MDKKINPIIEINKGIVSPKQPMLKSAKAKSINDYYGIPSEYLEIAQMYSSPFVGGPPLCDELVALVQHMFTPEEAQIMRYVKMFKAGVTAQKIASAEKRPVNEVSMILERLTNEKFIILSMGKEKNKRYFFLPLFPGAMENIMFRNSKAGLTEWHKRFAELFDKLYNTGYMTDYNKNAGSMVRYLPVGQSIESNALAWPTDKIEEILDRFDSFAVTYCQCRLTMDLKDKGCGKPLETCVMMGSLADQMINRGRMRRVERKEVIDIKKNAESHGLVTWMGNADSIAGSNISCSCCGCCCYMLRIVNQFNAPAMIAPPHFMPAHNPAKCKHCGNCALVCPSGAIIVDKSKKTRVYNRERCIGCGLCVTACSNKALTLESIPDYKRPPKNVLSYMAKNIPGIVKNVFHAIKTHKPQ